jgi:hypothetical protein
VPFVCELATLTGEARGQPAWRDLTIEQDLNGGMLAACVIDTVDQAAREVAVGERVLRVWEQPEGLLRFHGKLREPLTRTPGKIALAAGSPFSLLRRQLQAPKTFTQVDAGQIVRQLVNAENARSPTRLRVPAPQPSKPRDRTYELGKEVNEIILELGSVLDGFYFYERPVLDQAADVYTELVIRWPASGVERPGVRFEYGEGTLANLSDYTLTQSLPINAVSYAGAEVRGAVPVRRAQHAGSIATYDLIERFYSDPDVTVAATLMEAAQGRLHPEPVAVAGITTVAGGPALGAPGQLPRLWHDFAVGDTVFVSVRDDATQVYALPLRVTQAKLTVSAEDDSEQLELTFDTGPEEL